MERQVYSSGAPWESVVGYSRAVRVGPHVFVAGTAASAPDGSVVGVGDPYAQAVHILSRIGHALDLAGARFEHVVRTRIFVTDMAHWEAVGRAHGEVFRNIRPASTLVQVCALIDPAMLVEIEVDALVPE